MVTNLDITVGLQRLYDDMYSERDEMKNGIKDQQLELFAHRASSSDFEANQLRLLLNGLAYTLANGMRRMDPSATNVGRASPETICFTLLKVGRVVQSVIR